MYWMAVDIDVHSNGKVLALAERLGVSTDEAVGVLARLWSHAMRDADRAGRLRHASAAVFAEVFRRSREVAAHLTETLVEVGLLDAGEGGYAVHGWEERQAAWYAWQGKLEYNKRRNRTMRCGSTVEETEKRENVVQQVYTTVPDQTVPNRTIPDGTWRGGGEDDRAPAGAPSLAQLREETIGKRQAENIAALYAELCPSLPQVMLLTRKRREAVRRQLKRLGLDVIHDGFARAEATPFLNGRNGRGWKASFDWLMAGDNLLKVLEGCFDDSGRNGDPRLETSYACRDPITKEQFEAMKSRVFDLAAI